MQIGSKKTRFIFVGSRGAALDLENFADRVMKSVCIGQIVAGEVDPDLPPAEAIALLKGMFR